MTISLDRPVDLDASSWTAIEDHVSRLQRAQRDNDLSLVIGSAKDLAETIAKIVVEFNGEVVSSNADLPALLTKAHSALDRLPGHGTAAAAPLRNIAQGTKTIISQLPELRNRFGTGHGRVLTPEIDEELAALCLDAVVLWSRWALRRLGHLLAGRPLSLITALQEGIFYKGDLRKRLKAVDLPGLDAPDQRLIAVAVAHRAMRDTYVVKDEGVEACAEQPDLEVWPANYRIGLVEGLFLDREGYLDCSAWGVKAAAEVITPVPVAAHALQELSAKLSEAIWSYQYLSDPDRRDQVVAAMRASVPVFRNAPAKDAWEQILRLVEP